MASSAAGGAIACPMCTYENVTIDGSGHGGLESCEACGSSLASLPGPIGPVLARTPSEAVAEVTGVTRKRARAVLDRTKDAEVAADVILAQAPLVLSPPLQEAAAASESFDCPACLEEKDAIDCGTISACGHAFCLACIKAQVEAQMKEGKRTAFPCLSCPALLSQSELRFILGEEAFATLERRALEGCLITDKSLKTCPTPDCGFIVFMAPATAAGGSLSSSAASGPIIPILDCPTCKKTSCLACGASPYHEEGGPCPRELERSRGGAAAVGEAGAGAAVAVAAGSSLRGRQNSGDSTSSGDAKGRAPPPAKRQRTTSASASRSSSASSSSTTSGGNGASAGAGGGAARPPWRSGGGPASVPASLPSVGPSPARSFLTTVVDTVYTAIEAAVASSSSSSSSSAGLPPRPPGAASSSTGRSALLPPTGNSKPKPLFRTVAEMEAHLSPDQLEMLKSSNGSMKPCPRCLNFVEKASGCDKMMCVCGYRFCFNCLAENASAANGCHCTPAFHGFVNNAGGGTDFSDLSSAISRT